MAFLPDVWRDDDKGVIKVTYKQAVSQLSTLIEDAQSHYTNDGDDEVFHDDAAALELAIKALRRLTPKKPTLSDSGDYGICPNYRCRRLILQYEPTHGDIEIPHCKWCGQALDWGDTHD